jgi:hypothetical protein
VKKETLGRRDFEKKRKEERNIYTVGKFEMQHRRKKEKERTR